MSDRLWTASRVKLYLGGTRMLLARYRLLTNRSAHTVICVHTESCINVYKNTALKYIISLIIQDPWTCALYSLDQPLRKLHVKKTGVGHKQAWRAYLRKRLPLGRPSAQASALFVLVRVGIRVTSRCRMGATSTVDRRWERPKPLTVLYNMYLSVYSYHGI